jgi:hypothetical protein
MGRFTLPKYKFGKVRCPDEFIIPHGVCRKTQGSLITRDFGKNRWGNPFTLCKQT